MKTVYSLENHINMKHHLEITEINPGGSRANHYYSTLLAEVPRPVTECQLYYLLIVILFVLVTGPSAGEFR